MHQVCDVMDRALVGVSPGTSVPEAETMAAQRGVEHLLVLDNDDLVGTISLDDLHLAGRQSRVFECMRSPVRTIRATASLGEADALMRRSNLAFLPVVAGGLLLGVLTRARLVSAKPAPEADGLVSAALH